MNKTIQGGSTGVNPPTVTIVNNEKKNLIRKLQKKEIKE